MSEKYCANSRTTGMWTMQVRLSYLIVETRQQVFLTRSDHANHELHRVREENLEGAGAGEAQRELL